MTPAMHRNRGRSLDRLYAPQPWLQLWPSSSLMENLKKLPKYETNLRRYEKSLVLPPVQAIF